MWAIRGVIPCLIQLKLKKMQKYQFNSYRTEINTIPTDKLDQGKHCISFEEYNETVNKGDFSIWIALDHWILIQAAKRTNDENPLILTSKDNITTFYQKDCEIILKSQK